MWKNIDLFCGKDSYAKYKVDSMDCIEAVEGLKAERIRNAISNVNSVRPDAVSEYPVVGIRLQCYKYLGLDPKCEKRYDQRFFEKNDFMALMDKEIECQIKEKVGKSRIFDFQGRELKAR